MRLEISRELLTEIINHAQQERPIEACGYLAGNNNGVSLVYRMTNADNSPEHYSFIPEEQFKAAKTFRAEDRELLGVYHSHPASPARMSEEDKRLAFDRSIFYVIVSLMETEPVIKAFRFNKHELVEAPIVVI